MENIFYLIIIIGIIIYALQKNNEKKSELAAIQRKESEKKEEEDIRFGKKLVVYQQFKDYFKSVFSSRKIITKAQLQDIFDNDFSHYKNGNFDEFYWDISFAGIIDETGVRDEITGETGLYKQGISYGRKYMNFPNFMELMITGRYLDDKLSSYFERNYNRSFSSSGSMTLRKFIYISKEEKYQINYKLYFNLQKGDVINKDFEFQKLNEKNFYLYSYVQELLMESQKIGGKRDKRNIKLKVIELEKDLDPRGYNKFFNQWFKEFIEYLKEEERIKGKLNSSFEELRNLYAK